MLPLFSRRVAGRWPLLAVGLALAAGWAEGPRAEQPEQAIESELRIAEIRLRERRVLLTDAILYEAPDGALLVPFAPLMAALELRLEATPQGGITGWFLRENQTLDADPGTGRVKVAGRDLALLPGDLALIEGELHISSAALDRWLALGTRWDQSTQTLVLAPPYLLPAEELAARERTAGRGGGREGAIDTTGFLPVAASWALASWPHVTLNVAGAYDERAGAAIVQANALAEGDLLWATGRLAVAGTSQGGFDARLTLSRQDPQAGLLGLGGTIIEAGDIAVTANPLLQRNLFGVGVRFGREPLGAVGEFDRSDLIGDAPPGWQAELFRDSELLGFQTIADDGRYFFPQVPVLFGLNRFRIVLYGPAGERREIPRNIDIGGSLIRPGELRYNVVAMKQGYALFDGRLERNPALSGTDPALPENPAPGPAAAPIAFQQAATYLEARAAYGLTRNLGVSGFAAWRRRDGDGEAFSYLGAGSVARLGPVLAAFDALAQQDGALAARASLTTGIGPASLTATHERFDVGFQSEDGGPERGGIARRSQAVIDARLGGIGLGLGVILSDFRNGGSDRTVNLRANTMLGGFSLANTLFWRDFRSAPDVSGNARIDGQLAVSGGLGPVRLRTGVDYSLMPATRFRRVRGELSTRLGNWFVAATGDRDLQSGAGQWGLVTSRDWNGIRLGTDIRYEDSRKDWRGLLTLSLAFDRDPLGRGLRFGRDASSQRGSLVARGFRDSNDNGRRDPGEDLLGGFDAQLDPRGRTRRSNGTILAEELPLDRAVALLPVLEGIDDPFLAPVAPGYLVSARAGRSLQIDIPLVETGEVVALSDLGADTVIELVSCATGDSVQRQRPAFDGQAFFPAVLPGCYEVRAGQQRTELTVIGGEVTRVQIRSAEGPTDKDHGRH